MGGGQAPVAVTVDARTAGAGVQRLVHQQGVEHRRDGRAETAQALAYVGADAVAGTVRVVNARMAVGHVSRHLGLLISVDLRPQNMRHVQVFFLCEQMKQ